MRGALSLADRLTPQDSQEIANSLNPSYLGERKNALHPAVHAVAARLPDRCTFPSVTALSHKEGTLLLNPEEDIRESRVAYKCGIDRNRTRRHCGRLRRDHQSNASNLWAARRS